MPKKQKNTATFDESTEAENSTHVSERLKKYRATNIKRIKDEVGPFSLANHKPVERKLHKSPYNFNLYDVKEVEKSLQLLVDNQRVTKEKKSLEIMVELGGVVRLRKLPKNFESVLNKLESEYPHFSNVVAKLRSRMRLISLRKHPAIDFGRGLLLTGPAGTGKSSFLSKLSEAMNTVFYAYSCAARSNVFDLVGLSAKWGTGSAGKIHDLLVNEQCPNPIILLDEIDKVSKHNGNGGSFEDALYGVLERNDAKRFRDEHIDQSIDASRINWFATANDASLLAAPIRDRFDVVEVRLPTRQELQKMVPNLYRKALVELNMQPYFASKLDSDVIRVLAQGSGVSIRQIKASIEEGLTNAANRQQSGKKIRIKVEDVSGLAGDTGQNKPQIGFIWHNTAEGGAPQMH